MGDVPTDLQDKIDAIKATYKPKIDALVARGKAIAEDYDQPGGVGTMVGADVKVEWNDVDFVFDVPSVTINDKEMSFDVPEVTMAEQNWSFGVPDVCQKDTYPFPWPLDHVVVKIPYPCVRQVKIIFHLPSVTMTRHEIVIGIPVFGTSRVRWVITLPQFTVINVRAEIDYVAQQAKQLEVDSNAVASAMKQEISQAVSDYLNPKGQGDAAQRQGIQMQYDTALTRLSSAISEVQAAGGDPTTVPDGKGGTTNLRATYDGLSQQRADTLAKLDETLQIAHDTHMASV